MESEFLALILLPRSLLRVIEMPQVWSVCSDLKTRQLKWTLNQNDEPVSAYLAAGKERIREELKNIKNKVSNV